jgi:hypothetical protein
MPPMVHMLYRPCTDDEKSLFRPSTGANSVLPLDSGAARRGPRLDAGEGSWKMGRHDLLRYHGPAVSTITRRSFGIAAPRSNALLRT